MKEGNLTMLVFDLRGKHPDDMPFKIPYEKGSVFLWYLEELVGGAGNFEPFLRDFNAEFKFKSIHSDDFKVDQILFNFFTIMIQS